MRQLIYCYQGLLSGYSTFQAVKVAKERSEGASSHPHRIQHYYSNNQHCLAPYLTPKCLFIGEFPCRRPQMLFESFYPPQYPSTARHPSFKHPQLDMNARGSSYFHHAESSETLLSNPSPPNRSNLFSPVQTIY